MEQLLVVGGRFDGVADRVAEVQDHAKAVFALVDVDGVGFDVDGGDYDIGEGLEVRLLGEDGGGVLFEVAEELWLVLVLIVSEVVLLVGFIELFLWVDDRPALACLTTLAYCKWL